MTKLDILQIHREQLTAAMDALIDAKLSIDKAIGKIGEDIEKVKADILEDLNHTRKQYEADQKHINLENAD